LDTGGLDAARPWIAAANPEHPALIDVAHVCDDLFGIINVPNWVWIDGDGMIVRPAEPAWPGSTPVIDMLPAMTAHLPPEGRGVVDEVMRMRIDPHTSLTMLLDWAEYGAGSRCALSPEEVVARSRRRDLGEATAAAHFELGQHFFLLGDNDAAVEHWRTAHALFPDNWTYKRQAWNLESIESQGKPTRYDGNWLADVRAVGAENYYPPVVP
jgi:hypothetical protein